MVKMPSPILAWVTAIIIFIISSQTFASHCYRRCNCLKQTSRFKTECPQNKSYLTILLQSRYIDIYCKNSSKGLKSMPIFNAEYLTELSNKSAFNIKSMITKCYKSKEKHLQYKVNYHKLQNVTVDNNILEDQKDLKYLNIEWSSDTISTRNDILNFETNFLDHTVNLESLKINNINISKLGYFFNYITKLNLLNLASNNIEILPENIFENLHGLKILNIRNNHLKNVKNFTFGNLKMITEIDLSQNEISFLDEKTFESLDSLRYVNLSNNKLSDIKSNTFNIISSLEYLDLSNNVNINLPKYPFKYMKKLKNLNLSNNNLGIIENEMLFGCERLEDLNLANNDLRELNNVTFHGLKLLSRIDLSCNKIKIMPKYLFFTMDNLKVINLQNNRLTIFDFDIFGNLPLLQEIDFSNNIINHFESQSSQIRAERILLRNNSITKFPEFLAYGMHLKLLDLGLNKIESVHLNKEIVVGMHNLNVNLSYNSIRNINITDNNNPIKNISSVINWLITMDLSNNPIICNCDKFKVVSVNSTSTTRSLLTIRKQQNVCKNTVTECPLISVENCPKECDCYYRKKDTAIVVDCFSKQLSCFPKIKDLNTNYIYKHNQTVALFKRNRLDLDGQEEVKNYDNVTVLDLSDNHISKLKFIPPKLKWLSLKQNRLRNINEELIREIRNIHGLQKIVLDDNSWNCECSAIHLQKYLIQFNNIKVNQSAVICNNTGEFLVYTKVCESTPSISTVVLPVSFTTVLALVSAFLALYYRYKINIKVYLYSKNICLWCVAEEELDQEKTYDIFISYSNKDEHFVQKEILPELEHIESPFKVCIHYRNWLPGEFISKQIINSVLDSRRTLVVLSNSFMESVWGKMEFRTAHTQAISEGRARVIVVIYGDLDEENLDEEMKAYLKTNTYVKWGDPWFWNKLKYALPHSKYRRSKPNQNVENFT